MPITKPLLIQAWSMLSVFVLRLSIMRKPYCVLYSMGSMSCVKNRLHMMSSRRKVYVGPRGIAVLC